MKASLQNLLHPATIQLLKHQSIAKFSKLTTAFRNPRRQKLTFVALVLGCVWCSQAVAGIMLRKPTDQESLRVWLPLGLFVYALWHLVKITTRKPVEPFEWTPAEYEFVCAAPISRKQRVSYRMASILSSSMLKAACFSVVMIPDLNSWMNGFVGMLLGLLFIDLMRVAIELTFDGVSKPFQMVARCVVVGSLISVFGWVLFSCLADAKSSLEIASPGALVFFQSLMSGLTELMTTSMGTVLLGPFVPFGELMLAESLTFASLGWMALSIAIVVGETVSVYGLDDWRHSCKSKFEARNYRRALMAGLDPTADQKRKRPTGMSVPWRIRGCGSLAWRQLLGAYHYRTTLAVSLGIPTLLCCIPLLANHEPFFMLLNLVAGVVFYSFLLLPSALMLDFRRDAQRISVLKSLPIGPTAVTLGQLAAPVLICSAFQWGVLTIAVLSGSVIGWQALVAAILLVPVNTLIFAIENFIFMLSPYRRNQEGLDVFLRTILTFTAKGLMFALALAMLVAWAFASKSAAEFVGWSNVGAGLVFGLGVWCMTVAMAMAFVYGIIQIYDRFDPSQDAPAVS